MRPDHFGCEGYARDTTPNLDRIAREGVRFTRAYCNSSPCVPARASFASGRFGVHHGALTHWGPGSEFRVPADGIRYHDDMPLLPRYLRQHGYRTATFSTFADRHQAHWFSAGWSEAHTPSLKTGNENADEVNAAVLPWIDAHAEQDDWFLHVQYWDPHRNYTVAQEWIDLVAGGPLPDWPDEAAIATHQANPGPFTASELFPNRSGKSPVPSMPDQVANLADWKRFVDGYDGAIRFMDDQIGRLFAALDAQGVLDDTAIIVSADHGEAMGEHGVYGDHVCAGESVHNIPLVVRWPGGAQNRTYDGLLYNLDVHPTLCDLLGIPTPPGWDGQSFAAAVGGAEWSGRPYLVLDHALYSCQRAVRTPDWSFVRTYHPGLYPFPETTLFDMRIDPHQTTNLAPDHPDIVAAMDHLMQEWLHAAVGHPGSPPDPMPEVIRTGPWKYVKLDPWIKRLRAKGRDAYATAILQRLGLEP
jgi:arylsulfatase A-like enzyme